MLTFRELYLWIKDLSNRSRCCGNKQRCSKKSAIKAKAAMEKKTGRLFDIYWCPWCRKWHIGGSVNYPSAKALGLSWHRFCKRKEVIMKLYRLAALSAVFEDGVCDYELLHNESFTEQEFKTQIQICLEQVKPFAEQYILSPAKGMHTEPIHRWDDDTIKSVCEKMVEIFGYEIPEYALIYNHEYYSQFSTIFDLPVNVSNEPLMTGEEFDRRFGHATYTGTTLPARVVDKGE